MSKTILSGHTSAETAYVVNDYPYGFRLRCQIRYWLEFKKGKGSRLVSQTSNPKVAGLVWNKPKASTYSDFGGCMFLDDKGHVQWAGLTCYAELASCRFFLAEYRAGLTPEVIALIEHTIKLKEVYEAGKLAGLPYQYAGIFATLVVTGGKTEENARAIVDGMIAKANAAAATPAPVAAGSVGVPALA